MPFQSEKQRRYLHANHPEIAKRWERDYANGGITLPKGPAGITSLNGWGSKDSSQNKAGADISASMDKNPNDPGWGGGGGKGGGGGPPSIKNPPKGPTAEEIAAAKAKAEAEKRRLEIEARKKHVKDFKKTQKKKKNILDKWKDHATASEHMDLTGFGSHEKKGYNFAQNFPTAAKTIGPGLAKAYQYAQELGRSVLDGPGKYTLSEAWEEAGKQSDANIKGMIGEGFDKDKYAEWMEEQGYTAAKGGVARKKYYKGSNGILDIDEESEDISLTAFNPNFDEIPQLTDEEQLQIDSEDEEEGEKRIDLFSETEESDPLNELLLAEDGVTTLFRAKNGGYAVQGGVKNYLGEQKMVHAPKHWQSAPDHPETELTYITKPEKDLLVKADLHGSLHGSVNRGPQGLASLNGWGDAEDDFGGWGNDPQGEFGGIDSGGWDPGVTSDTGAVTSDAGWDNTSPNVETISSGDIWDWDDTSDRDDVLDQKQDIVNRAILFMRDKYPKSTNYAKDPSLWTEITSIPTSPWGIAFAIGKDMYNTKELKDLMKEMEDAGLVGGPPGTNPQIYDEMWMHLENRKRKKDEEEKDDDGPEVVPVAPVMEELQYNEQMAWDPMSYLDKIRAGQAQRASLQAKGIIQDNETMTLNSGGLANLFRVKNY